MMLAAYPSGAQVESTWLVFLHGLLGDHRDWAEVLGYCEHWPCLTIDLPGHGASTSIAATGFDAFDAQLAAALSAAKVRRYWLIGYSLGGRLAMYHATRRRHAGLLGVVVESAHPGLFNAAERARRRQEDEQWAQRLRTQPLAEVLEAWYRRPVFADLNPAQRQWHIAKRLANDGPAIARFLEATSMGRQPWLWPRLKRLGLLRGYLCGERDAKFMHIAQAHALPLKIIPSVGHNAHWAQPSLFASHLLACLTPA